MAYDPNAFRTRADARTPQIEMTLDGSFRAPSPGKGSALALRIGTVGVVVAILAAGIGIAALALWVAMLVIPIALGGALVAYLAFRYQMWRARSAGGLRRM